ncbi:MAG: hypothetical protein HRT71_01550 [Flavobacteriales bacterium]|nr:hypothetical protein [Flavobacteriales bacterium]
MVKAVPIKFLAVLFCTVLWSVQLIAQIEDKLVTINAQDYELSDVLFELSDQAYFDFSYDAKSIPPDFKVSLSVKEQKLGIVLDALCSKAELTYKVEGDQINFYPLKDDRQMRSGWTLNGTITNKSRMLLLDSVIVEDKYLGIKSITNSYGEYELKIPNPDYKMELIIHKQGYITKEIEVKINSDLILNIQLEKEPVVLVTIEKIEKPVVVKDTVVAKDTTEMFMIRPPRKTFREKLLQPVHKGFLAAKLLSKKIIDHIDDSVNISEMPIVLTIVPGVSTNPDHNSSTIINGFVFNLLIGYSAGLEGVEVSPFINIDRFNVRGVQLAGLANINGGITTGIQAAGFSNMSKMKVEGVQAAGFSNIAGFNVKGVQASGFSNIVRGSLYGVQGTGFNNIVTNGGKGIQSSGFANTVHGDWEGIQGAGFVNVATGEIKGVQGAGFANFAKEVIGVQGAGFANFAKEIRGVQGAGFLNYAKVVNGVQIGMFNFSDTIESGIAIGLFSFSKKGFRRYNLAYESTGFYHFKFKSGSKMFYNILSVGYHPGPSNENWAVGYGIGSRIRDQKMYVDMEGMFYSFSSGNPFDDDFQGSLNLNFGYSFANRFAIFVGPSLNIQVSNGSEILNLTTTPEITSVLTNQDHFSKYWLGFNAGIEF